MADPYKPNSQMPAPYDVEQKHDHYPLASSKKEEPQVVWAPSDPKLTSEVAQYIAQMTVELAQMSRSAKLDLLAYFLEMAKIEATTQARHSVQDSSNN